jgi:hypothetical protein
MSHWSAGRHPPPRHRPGILRQRPASPGDDGLAVPDACPAGRDCLVVSRAGLEAATARLAKQGWGLRAAMAPGQECDLRHISLILEVTSGQSRTPTDTYEQSPAPPRPRSTVCALARTVTQWKQRERGTCPRWRADSPGHRQRSCRHRARPYRSGLAGGGHEPLGDPPSQLRSQARAFYLRAPLPLPSSCLSSERPLAVWP